jgi:hypothetical protein
VNQWRLVRRGEARRAPGQAKTPKELAQEEIQKRQRKLQNALLAMKSHGRRAEDAPSATSVPPHGASAATLRVEEPSLSSSPEPTTTTTSSSSSRAAGISSDAAARKSGDQPWRYDAEADQREWRSFWS